MILLVGYKAADLQDVLAREDARNIVCHTLDVYHRHAIEKTFHGEVRAICTPHLPQTAPDGSPWERVVFRTGPKLTSGELALDLLQECIKTVGENSWSSRVELDYVGRERDRNDLLDKVKERVDRSFKAEWPASVPGGEKLMFTSYPGCFCHRRLDEGGLALAETVVREVKSKGEKVKSKGEKGKSCGGLSILDMGCGCGLVGLLIAKNLADNATTNFVPREVARGTMGGLVMVDSHTRAVEAATENAAKFGIPAEVILSDNGSPARMDGTFDIFVGNPPYYSDYRIADVFLETAKRALKSGGVCYTVCKNAAGLEPVQRRYFPDVEILRRRGYAILKSVKT